MSITGISGSGVGDAREKDGDAPLRAKAEDAAEKFEAFFIAEMLRQMRRSARELAGDDGMFQDRAGQDMLDMADTMTADALAGQRAFGIADMLLRQILPPEAAQKSPDDKNAAPI